MLCLLGYPYIQHRLGGGLGWSKLLNSHKVSWRNWTNSVSRHSRRPTRGTLIVKNDVEKEAVNLDGQSLSLTDRSHSRTHELLALTCRQ